MLLNPMQGKALIKQSGIEISILPDFLAGQELFFQAEQSAYCFRESSGLGKIRMFQWTLKMSGMKSCKILAILL
jgi:hypothetical protein